MHSVVTTSQVERLHAVSDGPLTLLGALLLSETLQYGKWSAECCDGIVATVSNAEFCVGGT